MANNLRNYLFGIGNNPAQNLDENGQPIDQYSYAIQKITGQNPQDDMNLYNDMSYVDRARTLMQMTNSGQDMQTSYDTVKRRSYEESKQNAYERMNARNKMFENKRNFISEQNPEAQSDLTLSNEERVNLFKQGKRDIEIESDIQHLPIESIRMKWGDEIGNYTQDLQNQQWKLLEQSTLSVTKDYNTAHNEGIINGTKNAFKSVIGGIGQGMGNILTTTEQALALTDDDTSETEKQSILGYINEDAIERTNTINEYIGPEKQASALKNRNAEEIVNLAKSVKHISDSEAENMHDALTPLTGIDITTGVGEQVPNIVLALSTGGIGSGIVGGTAKVAAQSGVKKQIAKELIANGVSRETAIASSNQLVKNFAKLSVKEQEALLAGVTKQLTERTSSSAVERMTAEILSKQLPKLGVKYGKTELAGSMIASGTTFGSMDYLSTASEAREAFTDWYNGLDLKGKKDFLNNSDFAKKLRKENPNITYQEIYDQALHHIGVSAGIKSGLFTGITSALAQPFLQATFGKTFPVLGMGKSGTRLTQLFEPAVEGIEESSQEAVNIFAPMQEMEKMTGDSEYAYKDSWKAKSQIKQAGTIAAITGGVGAVKSAGGIAKNATGFALNKALTPINRNVTKQLNELNQQANNQYTSNSDTDSDTNKGISIDSILGEKAKANLQKLIDENKEDLKGNDNISGLINLNKQYEQFAQNNPDISDTEKQNLYKVINENNNIIKEQVYGNYNNISAVVDQLDDQLKQFDEGKITEDQLSINGQNLTVDEARDMQTQFSGLKQQFDDYMKSDEFKYISSTRGLSTKQTTNTSSSTAQTNQAKQNNVSVMSVNNESSNGNIDGKELKDSEGKVYYAVTLKNVKNTANKKYKTVGEKLFNKVNAVSGYLRTLSNAVGKPNTQITKPTTRDINSITKFVLGNGKASKGIVSNLREVLSTLTNDDDFKNNQKSVGIQALKLLNSQIGRLENQAKKLQELEANPITSTEQLEQEYHKLATQLEKFFVRDNIINKSKMNTKKSNMDEGVKFGFMQYVSEVLDTVNGKNSNVETLKHNMNRFIKSQAHKAREVNKLYDEMKKDGYTLEDGNFEFDSPKEINVISRKGEKEKVTFDNMRKLKAYKDAIDQDGPFIESLQNLKDLVENKDAIKSMIDSSLGNIRAKTKQTKKQTTQKTNSQSNAKSNTQQNTAQEAQKATQNESKDKVDTNTQPKEETQSEAKETTKKDNQVKEESKVEPKVEEIKKEEPKNEIKNDKPVQNNEQVKEEQPKEDKVIEEEDEDINEETTTENTEYEVNQENEDLPGNTSKYNNSEKFENIKNNFAKVLDNISNIAISFFSGFSTKENLIAKCLTAKTDKNLFTISEVDESLDFITNVTQVTDTNKKEVIKHLSKLIKDLNRNSENPVLESITNTDDLSALNNVVKYFKAVEGIYSKVHNTFKDIKLFSDMKSLNVFANFLDLKNNKELQWGITKSIIFSAYEIQNLQGSSFMMKELVESSKKSMDDWYIQDISFAYGLPTINGTQFYKVQNKENRDKYLKKYKVNYSNAQNYLGLNDNQVVEIVSRNFLNAMNFKFKRGIPRVVQQAMRTGFAVELMHFMLQKHIMFRQELSSIDENNNQTIINFFYGINCPSYSSFFRSNFTFNTYDSYEQRHGSNAKKFANLGNQIKNYPKNGKNITNFDKENDTFLFNLLWLNNNPTFKQITKEISKETKNDDVSTHLFIKRNEKVPQRKYKIKDIFNFGKNSIRKQNLIDSVESIGYSRNNNLNKVFENNSDFIRTSMGYIPEEELENWLPVSRDNQEAKNRQIQSNIDAITNLNEEYASAVQSNETTEDDIRLHFRYKMLENGRVMQEDHEGTIDNKLTRQIWLPTNENNKVSIDDATGNVVYQSQDKITLPKKEDNKPRKINELFNSTSNSNELGFAIALAQALDIKVEKAFINKRSHAEGKKEIVSELIDTIKKHSWIIDVADILYKVVNNETITEDEQKVLNNSGKEINKLVGNNAPHLINALIDLGMYRNSNENEITIHTFLELDGIANGMSNIIRQFSTEFTREYIDFLRATGQADFEFLLKFVNASLLNQGITDKDQMINELIKTFSNENGELDRIFEGSSSIFNFPIMNRGGEVTYVSDIYEQLANTANFNLNTLEVDNHKIIVDMLRAYLQDYDGAISELHLFNRSFMKLAAVPSTYGSGARGIVNQVKSEIVSNFRKQINEVYQYLSTKEAQDNIVDTRKIINDLSNLLIGKTASNARLIDIDNMKIFLIQLEEYISSKEFERNNISVFGGYLKDVIREVVPQIQTMSEQTVLDTDGINIFTDELWKRYEYTLTKRNKDKGYYIDKESGIWVDKDGNFAEDAYELLNENEIAELAKTIINIPIMGTAFNVKEPAFLIQDIIKNGHTFLSKGEKLDVSMLGISGFSSRFVESFLNEPTVKFKNTGNPLYSTLRESLRLSVYQYVTNGAANYTSSVVTTEVQSAQEMLDEVSKKGIGSNYTYDGHSSSIEHRKYISELLNKGFDKIHSQFSVMYEFYLRNMKTAIALYDIAQKVNIDKILSAYGNKNEKINLTTDEINYLCAIKKAILAYNDNLTPISGNDDHLLLEKAYQSPDKKLDNINSIKLISSIYEILKDKNTILPDGFSKEDAFSFDMLLIHLNNTLQNQHQQLVNHYETQLIHQKLPAWINQFSGGGTGYKLNISGDKVKELIDSGDIKINDNGELDFNIETHINKIKEEIKDDVIAFANSIPSITFENKESNSNQKVLEKEYFDSTNSSLVEILKHIKEKYSNKNSVKDKVYTLLLDGLIKFTENNKDIKIQTTYDKNSYDGKYISTEKTIYINIDNITNGDHLIKTILHETLHSVTTNSIHNLIDNIDTSKTFINIESISQYLKNKDKYIHNIFENMIAFANFYKNDSEVKELLDKYITTGYNGVEVINDSSLNLSVDKRLALSILIFLDTQERTDIDNVDRVSDLDTILNEFIAYSLTDETTINKSQFIKGKSLINLIKNTVIQVSKYLYGVLFTGSNINAMGKSVLINTLADVLTMANNTDTTKKTNINKGRQKPLYQVSKSKSTNGMSAHNTYLSDLVNIIAKSIYGYDQLNNSNVTGSITPTPENKVLVDDLRKFGIKITPYEEAIFNIVESILGNSTQDKALSVGITNINKDLLNSSNLNAIQKTVLFNKKQFTPTKVFVLATISEELQSKLSPESLSIIQNTKFDRIVGKVAKNKSNKDIIKNIIISKKDEIKLKQERAIRLANERAKVQNSIDFANNVLKASNNITIQPLSSVSKTISMIIADIAVGKQQNFNTGANNDSLIGDTLQKIMELRNIKKGGKDWLAGIIRWVLQARENTQYIYQMKNEFGKYLSDVREKLQVAYPQIIISKFKGEFTDEMNNIVHRTILNTQLSNLLKDDDTLYGKEVISYLTDNKAKQQKIDDLIKELKQEIQTLFNQHNIKLPVDAIVNYYIWQTKGLGELMVSRQAKGRADTKSHHILGNANLIASLASHPSFNDWAKNEFGEHIDNQSGFFYDLMQVAPIFTKQLATLYSFDYISDANKQALADMIADEEKGVEAILQSMNNIQEKDGVSILLGNDGSIYKTNSNELNSIKIVKKDDVETINKLKKYGYTERTTLAGGQYIVLVDDYHIQQSFNQGVFNLFSETINGVKVLNNTGLNNTESLAEDNKTIMSEWKKEVALASKDANYYDKLDAISNIKPNTNYTGQIIGHNVELPSGLRDSYKEPSDLGIYAIGNYDAYKMEISVGTELAKQNIDILNQAYHLDKNKAKYVKIDSQTFKQNFKNQKFQKQLSDFYTSLPLEVREYINEVDGLYININEVSNIIGYENISIVDLFKEDASLPKPVKVVIAKSINALSEKGFNVIKYLKMGETLLKETVSFGKDIILNRSLLVAGGNMASNIIHLINVTGLSNTKNIPKDIEEGYFFAKQFEQNQARIYQIDRELLNKNILPQNKVLLEREREVLQQSIENNPALPLINDGMITSLNAETGFELSKNNPSQKLTKSLMNKGLQKIHLDKPLSKLENTRTKKWIDNVLINENSDTHKTMVNLLDFGDFTAKYALYKYLTKQRNFSSQRALNVCRDEFVNYSMNRGAVFDYANAMGLTWFMSYATGIQKVIWRRLRTHTLGTLTTYGITEELSKKLQKENMGLLSEFSKSVPMQNVYERAWWYTFNPFNTFSTPESHYLIKLFKWMF